MGLAARIGESCEAWGEAVGGVACTPAGRLLESSAMVSSLMLGRRIAVRGVKDVPVFEAISGGERSAALLTRELLIVAAAGGVAPAAAVLELSVDALFGRDAGISCTASSLLERRMPRATGEGFAVKGRL